MRRLVIFAALVATLSVPAFASQDALATSIDGPMDGWFPQDTADALYRRARAAFSDGNYQQAVELFRSLRTEHRESRYLGQAMYYEAFALSRLANETSYHAALNVLDAYRERFGISSNAEVSQLYTRIQGSLARLGNAEAAAAVAAQASQVTAQAADRSQQARQNEEDVRLQALNALMQMDPDNAIPILRDVIANRDPARVELRRRAIMILAQKRGEGREEVLLDAARNDPDSDVRENAVYWLSQVRTDRAVAALDSILQASDDEKIRRRAIMALSQHRSERAGEILRGYARRADASRELRSQVIQWLGQSRGHDDFLRELYRTLDDEELRERTIFALSQSRNEENAQFLLSIALDADEPMTMRGRALFWVGQMRGVGDGFYQLYGRIGNRELQEQLIAAYAQRRRDSVAVDVLIEIARTEQDAELRNRAIFWLGQTRDARAAAFLRELINR